ncbi:hypothetical protein ACFQ51_50930 [Streptomyces kaempferi]
MASGTVGERLERHGVRLMDPDTAVTALQHALDHGDTTLVVTDIDWEVFGAELAKGRPRRLYAALPEARHALAARAAPHRSPRRGSAPASPNSSPHSATATAAAPCSPSSGRTSPTCSTTPAPTRSNPTGPSGNSASTR